LWESGSLTELQARFYQPSRPSEELYDLENDPYEINNLAGDPAYDEVLTSLRGRLYDWMDKTNDPVLIPEPILEELGKLYGNKFTAMKQDGMDELRSRLINIVESGERQNNEVLLEALNAHGPAERYWAVTWLGVNKARAAKEPVAELTNDPDPSVRIAANLALYKIDPSYDPIPSLGKEVNHENLIVGMYAMSAIEQTGMRSEAVKAVAQIASQSKYEFTKRYGTFLSEDRVVKQHSDNSRNW
ncbi:MAG: DUF4976 domain-containing protein, partial [Bacteroidales bacterium]|nr:DUF4976 domain-containing protein [Bacteroidales bacterium]